MKLPTLRDEITALLKQQSRMTDFSFVSPVAYSGILRRIGDRFLQKGGLDIEYPWWWERLRGDVFGFTPKDSFAVLDGLLMADENYWFIASEGSNSKKWLCEGSGQMITTVLRGIRHTEYYVAERKLGWLLGENHHGFLFAVGHEMPKRLEEATV